MQETRFCITMYIIVGYCRMSLQRRQYARNWLFRCHHVIACSCCVQLLQEFAKEAVRKKQVVEKLLESSLVRDAAEVSQLTEAWERVRSLEVNRSARLHEALQLVCDARSLTCTGIFFIDLVVFRDEHSDNANVGGQLPRRDEQLHLVLIS